MKLKITKRSNGTRRVQITCEGKGKTEQSHANDVNINSIMAKVDKGIMPTISVGSPMYGDFTEAQDFQTCTERILNAQLQFDSLPAQIRKVFDNDPAKLIAYINNPENEQDAIEMGLLPGPKASIAPDPVGDPEPNTEPAEPAEPAPAST